MVAPCFIMMHGHTAAGKSTVARYLARHLREVAVVHTAVIRREVGLAPEQAGAPLYQFKLDDPIFVQVSKQVYSEVLRSSEKIVLAGQGVILDGAYNFRWQREPVYDLAYRLLVPFAVVHCTCKSEDEVRRRLAKRRLSEVDPLAEANDWETYISTMHLADPLSEDQLPNGQCVPIVRFDTYEQTLDMDCPNSESYSLCQQIQEMLKNYEYLVP
jgi:predicted kinase